jgi:hypothetical protein
LEKKGAFAEFLIQHLQEIDVDDGTSEVGKSFLRSMKKVVMHVYVTGSVTEKWAVFLRILFFWDMMMHLWVVRCNILRIYILIFKGWWFICNTRSSLAVTIISQFLSYHVLVDAATSTVLI